MQNKIISKALSLTLAAVTFCGTVPMLHVQAASERALTSSGTAAAENESNALVSVIVSVAGDAVLAQPGAEALGADYLESAQAAQDAACLETVQERVQQRIRSIYPELKIRRGGDPADTAAGLAPFLISYFTELSEGNTFYDGVKSVIEGTHIDFERLMPFLQSEKYSRK